MIGPIATMFWEPRRDTDPPEWAMVQALAWWHKTFKHNAPDACVVNVNGEPINLCRNDANVIDRARAIAAADRAGWERCKTACFAASRDGRRPILDITYTEPKP